MAQTGVLVDDNPDETKTFLDEGDERDAAEHLDDELGLRLEMDDGANQRTIKVDQRQMVPGGVLPSLAPVPPQYIQFQPQLPALTPVIPPYSSYSMPPGYQHVQMTSPHHHHAMLQSPQQPMPDMSPWAAVRPPPSAMMVPQYSGLPRLQHHPAGSQPPIMSTLTQQEMEGARANKLHVKKPLNAFMLYMKDMRPHVIKECTLKESAAINQILGKKWHSLDRAEQARYYEMARKERALHQTLYPGWSARDNYATNKKKKKKKDKTQNDIALKKCRARYGLDQQEKWCKPCRRKKKCVRFTQPGDGEDADDLEGGAEEDDVKKDSSAAEVNTTVAQSES
eukprot:m.24614 g.24614  ORF g.24614 m.24614 type:complete len:338 (+) comp28653_c0_seq3:207-1220(+)